MLKNTTKAQGSIKGLHRATLRGTHRENHKVTIVEQFCETVLRLQHTVNDVEHCIQSAVFWKQNNIYVYCYLCYKQHIVVMVICENTEQLLFYL